VLTIETTGTTALTIDNAQKVGIGTTSPDRLLSLKHASQTEIGFKTGRVSNGALIYYNDSEDQLLLRAEESSDSITFQTGGTTERMRIDSSGRVGIGNAIPGSFHAGANNLVVGTGSGSEGITIYGGAESNIFFADGTATADNLRGRIEYSHGLEKMLFYVNNSNAMSIDSSGNVGIGTNRSSAVGDGDDTTHIGSDGEVQIRRASGTDRNMMKFRNGTNHVGSITTTSSATTYATSSDYRLKENVNYTWDATTRLKQLKPARFNFISDDTNTLVDGFIAHEVSSIVPEAIIGAKDAVDADNNPEYQGIDQSKLVPLLVKTIQELEARITALEG